MTGLSERGSYRAGAAVAVLASFLTVWTTIVRDDGTGVGWVLVIMAAMVGGFVQERAVGAAPTRRFRFERGSEEATN